MKIMFVITGLGVGGAENQLLILVKELILRGYKVKVVSFVDGDLKSSFEEAGADTDVYKNSLPSNLFFRYLKKTFSIFKYMKYVRDNINAFNPDLVHSFLSHSNIIVLWASLIYGKNTPIVTSYRVVVTKEKRLMLMEAFVHWNSDFAIANSKTGENALRIWRCFGVPTATIYNAFAPKIENKIDLYQKQEFVTDKKIIITVARFYHQKDYISNFKTAKKILSNRSDVCFFYVGLGPQKKNIEDIVMREGLNDSIFFLGHRNDISRLLSNSAVFFLPTRFESQSNALIEAMYYKIPIVTTNIDENIELLNRKYSDLVEPGDVSGFSRAIENKLNKIDNTIEIERNFNFVVSNLKVNNMVDSYLEIYKRIQVK